MLEKEHGLKTPRTSPSPTQMFFLRMWVTRDPKTSSCSRTAGFETWRSHSPYMSRDRAIATKSYTETAVDARNCHHLDVPMRHVQTRYLDIMCSSFFTAVVNHRSWGGVTATIFPPASYRLLEDDEVNDLNLEHCVSVASYRSALTKHTSVCPSG